MRSFDDPFPPPFHFCFCRLQSPHSFQTHGGSCCVPQPAHVQLSLKPASVHVSPGLFLKQLHLYMFVRCIIILAGKRMMQLVNIKSVADSQKGF